jgi:hypothetical protein
MWLPWLLCQDCMWLPWLLCQQGGSWCHALCTPRVSCRATNQPPALARCHRASRAARRLFANMGQEHMDLLQQRANKQDDDDEDGKRRRRIANAML